MKSRRTVIHNDKERPYGKGKAPKLWAYGYSDLAKLLGTTVGALRARVGRGWDPSSLEVVCRSWRDRMYQLGMGRRASKD